MMVASNATGKFSQRLLTGVAAADGLLGLVILFLPRVILGTFGLPFPPEMLWFQLVGLMLMGVGIASLLGFIAPDRYFGNVLISCAMRFATAGFLFTVAGARDVPVILVVLAVGEAIVGGVSVPYVARLMRAPS